jgi:hypothetical protein
MGAGKADDHRGQPPVAACPGAHPDVGDLELVAQQLCQSHSQNHYAATLVLERAPAVVIGEVPVVVRQNVPDRPHLQRHYSGPGDQAEEACSCWVNLQRDGDMVVSVSAPT